MENKKRYMDEEVMKERRKKEEEELDKMEILDKIEIDDISYEMEEKEILTDYIYIKLPVDYFFEMPEELKRLKYPSEFRPPIIKTTLDTKTNLTFNILNKKIEEEELLDFTKKIRVLKNRTSNAFEKITLGIINHSELKISYFDYFNSVLDGTVYIFEFFVLLEECILYGTFNCPLEKYKYWKKVLPKIIKTMGFVKENKN